MDAAADCVSGIKKKKSCSVATGPMGLYLSRLHDGCHRINVSHGKHWASVDACFIPYFGSTTQTTQLNLRLSIMVYYYLSSFKLFLVLSFLCTNFILENVIMLKGKKQFFVLLSESEMTSRRFEFSLHFRKSCNLSGSGSYMYDKNVLPLSWKWVYSTSLM